MNVEVYTETSLFDCEGKAAYIYFPWTKWTPHTLGCPLEVYPFISRREMIFVQDN